MLGMSLAMLLGGVLLMLRLSRRLVSEPTFGGGGTEISCIVAGRGHGGKKCAC